MKMFSVGWRSIDTKSNPLPENEETVWAIFPNKINAEQWSKEHGGKCKIRPVEVSLKFARPTQRAADVRKAGAKNVSSKSKVMVSPARG